MIGPLFSNGIISSEVNSLLAIIIGIFFGYSLQRSGFSDSRKISATFYLKDVDVPVVMFSAISTAAIGLWGMGLIGIIDLSKMYFLSSYLLPEIVAGLIFGVGMAVGGFCPGTSLVSLVTGKIDAMIFMIGFIIGTLIFGDFYPLWKYFYLSDANGVWHIDQLLNINVGLAVFIVTVLAFLGSIGLRKLQYKFWGKNV